MEEEARSIIASNDSPDLGFEFSVNPYRGCYHGCIYCYARPTHQYLGMGAGSDFERQLVVKVNAPRLLEEAFMRPSWKGEAVFFSGVTDCYQPLEASYGLTRACLEVCARFRNPVCITTKGALVRRDVDVLQRLHRDASVQVFISIPVLEDSVARVTEPYASPPSARFEAMRALCEAGIPTGISLAPLIPGLTEADLVPLLEKAASVGARHAFTILLRLPAEVLPVFQERVEQGFSPERSRHIFSALAEHRGGKLKDSRFGHRMVGQGPRWHALKQMFDLHCRRLGLNVEHAAAARTFVRPGQQLSLLPTT
jgi:DNA repair photolyase